MKNGLNDVVNYEMPAKLQCDIAPREAAQKNYCSRCNSFNS